MRNPRLSVLLERVHFQLGANRIEERWITHKHGWYGYQEPGLIVVSGLTAVPTIIHEALHAAYPAWTERGVARSTTALFDSLTDDESYRIYDAYGRKVKRVGKPVSGTED